MPRPSIFSKEEDLFIKNSVGTMSHSEIAKIINEKYGFEKFTKRQIQGRANNKGWYRENYHHTFNRRYFKEINSKEVAYWFGFLYADGYIINTPTTSEVSIELAAKDIAHLEKFKHSLDGDVPITTFISKDSVIKSTGQIVRGTEICQIRLYSKEMAVDLENKNLLQNKTYKTVSPDLCYSDEINIAIIRGFFDGDGCIDKNGACHFTAYSNVFLDKVQEFLESKGIKCSNYQENSKKQRLFVDHSSILKFLELIYTDISYPYLDRKLILANKFIKIKKQKLILKQSSYTTVNSVNVV